MRVFTIEQYVEMSEMFNKRTFHQKIKKIRANRDIFTLASDGTQGLAISEGEEIQKTGTITAMNGVQCFPFKIL